MRVLLAILMALSCSACGSESDDETGTGGQPEREGCDPATKLLENPDEPALAGAWPVGARVVDIQGLTAEVWYPAKPGSESGIATIRYDVREWLPESEKTKIPDADNPWQESVSHADLPLDEKHGPYPVIVFVHGTAGWRTQSLAHLEHWASRGFVVVAADHPGLYLGDILAFDTQRDLAGDLAKLVSAITSGSSGLDVFAGHLDPTRLGMVGHSAGGGAVESQGNTPGVRVIIPLAAGGVTDGSSLESVLIMGGKADAVAAYSNQESGYASSPTPKRLVGIDKAGHLFPTDLCHLANDKGENLVQIAQTYQIQNAQFASLLFDCPADEPSAERNRDIVNFATSSVLEPTLQCTPTSLLSEIGTRYPEVTTFEEATE
jgi:hypothetical protein